MKTPLKFVIVLTVIALSGCENTTIAGSETSDEICRQHGKALPTRARADTEKTQDQIQNLYATFALTCPGWEHLIP